MAHRHIVTCDAHGCRAEIDPAMLNEGQYVEDLGWLRLSIGVKEFDLCPKHASPVYELLGIVPPKRQTGKAGYVGQEKLP
jgi:hypothetical protein